MVSFSSAPSAWFSACHIGLLPIGGGGVAKVSVSAVTAFFSGGAFTLATASAGNFRNPGSRPDSAPGKSGCSPSNGLYVGSVSSPDAFAPPFAAPPSPQEANVEVAIAAPVTCRNRRRLIIVAPSFEEVLTNTHLNVNPDRKPDPPLDASAQNEHFEKPPTISAARK